jgi:hypothetical protein
MLQSRLIVLALVAVALAVAGCGKSSKSASSATQPASTAASTQTATTEALASGPPLGRAVFVAKANAVCRRFQTKQSHLTVRSRKEIAGVGAKRAAYEAEAIAAFDKLVPPTALAGEWKHMIADARLLSTDTATVFVFLEKGGSFRAAESKSVLGKTEAARKSTSVAATRLGLHDCALAL